MRALLPTIVATALVFIWTAMSRGQDPRRFLPRETHAVAVVSDYAAASRFYQPRQGWIERFGLTQGALANGVRGILLRAGVLSADGRTVELVIFRMANESAAQSLVVSAGETLQQRGAQRVGESKAGEPAVWNFAPDEQTPTGQIALHSLDGWVIIADHAAAVADVAARYPDGEGGWLSQQKPRAAIELVKQTNRGDVTLELFWYFDPFRALTQAAKLRTDMPMVQETLRIAQRHGLLDVQALAGSVLIDSTGRESARSAALAPTPLRSSLAMLNALQPAETWNAPPWLSGSNSAIMLHGDVPNALAHVDKLFDDTFADGVEGTYVQMLADLKDPAGLNIDLNKELFARLGPRAYLIHGAHTAERPAPFAMAFETDKPQQVRAAIRTLMVDDEEAKKQTIDGAVGELWVAPGVNTDEDFVLGAINNLALFANDAEWLASLFQQREDPWASRMQIQEATKRLVAGRSKPCGFVLRAPENDPKHERSPLALFFRRPDRWWRLQAAERDRRVLENLVPAFSHHRVVALYRESAGWIFVSHSLPARAKE